VHLHELTATLLARCNFPQAGSRLHCAVSGGADSLAMMVLATEAGCEVVAIHVDHGIRTGSISEATVVRAAAERFGAQFVSESVHVSSGPNLEARARAARYSVLPDDVAIGHTADDQVETTLMNLMRGAGLDGLASISPLRRPIIGLRRQETRSLCAALELTPVQDPSNADPAYTRNRVRNELLPLMNDIARRDIVPVVSRQVGAFREDAEHLQLLAGELDPTDAKALCAAPPSLAKRALRKWLRMYTDAELHPPGASAIERVMSVARGERRACEIEGGLRVSRSGQRLRIATDHQGR
jgi:tRNA(Ile)-lysidine synthase